MKRQYINIAIEFFEDFLKCGKPLTLIGKNAQRLFSALFVEPKFPKDAKIAEILYFPSHEIYRVYIESQTYPDVIIPTELQLICHKDNIWNIKETVTFT